MRQARILTFLGIIFLLASCTLPGAGLPHGKDLKAQPTVQITSVIQPTQSFPWLTDEEIATLESLQKIDDHPLYTMQFFGDYEPQTAQIPNPKQVQNWACSLFAAFADPKNMLYGRNFDWQHSPAVLLFTNPSGGYASVTMVDIAYLGYQGQESQNLLDLSLNERQSLLGAPFLPFDGMNEAGLVVGMAAVPPGNMQPDPDKTTTGSLGIMRMILDQAKSTQEAINIIEQYNIDFGGGPPIHYLIADRSGEAALVEFYQGEMVVTFNAHPWHLATNFLRASVGDSPEGNCWRYDRIDKRLKGTAGRVKAGDAMDLLSEVAQDNTQWSIVYDFGSGDIFVALDRAYEEVYTFQLEEMAP